MIVHRIQRDKSTTYIGPNQDSCVKMGALGRFDWAMETYNLSYVIVNQMAIPSPTELDKIPVEDYTVMVTSFSVEGPGDLGGTLLIEGTLDTDTFDVGVIYSINGQVILMFAMVYLVINGHKSSNFQGDGFSRRP